jgi:hypothetical protein
VKEGPKMSMTTYVYGIAPADDKWRAMKAIWDSCTAAGVAIPDEVTEFFNGEPPEPNGVKIDLRENHGVMKFEHDSTEGLLVDLDKLPKQVRLLKFCNSW